jgi:CheY-like chemotaxis protein
LCYDFLQMATTLLLADDSATIAKILKMALANEPYEIRSVLTAEEAITEFARLIKRDSKLRQVRVVLLASAFEPVDEVEYQACGADGLIKKPFDPAELRQSLRSITDAPPIFPAGSHVTGSLSGFMVNDGDFTGTSLGVAPAQEPHSPDSSPEDTLSNLLAGNQSGGDADAILSGLLGNDAGEPPAPFERTVNLDLTGHPNTHSTEDVLDISSSFDSGDARTAMIDFGAAASDPVAPAASEPPLSSNAQALAAFFEAEITSATRLPPAADLPPVVPPKAAAALDYPKMPPPADSFDASLTSIEWDSGAEADASLSGWSSNQPNKVHPSPDAPPAFNPNEKTTQGFSPMPTAAPRAAAPARATSGVSGGSSSQMFDTGGASFRFSENYISRITKAFTGAHDESVPDSHPQHQSHTPFFPQGSDDRSAPAPAPVSPPSQSPGGGAWSENDVQKIEQIVREEVQMVVREVAEKIAWEVIPELAF